MDDETLYRVEPPDNKLHSFQVTLGHGAYVNVIDRDTGLTLHTVNRSIFQTSRAAAWRKHSATLLGEIHSLKFFVIKALMHLSVMKGITTHYSRKNDDLMAAEDKVREWLLRLRAKRIEQQAAALRGTLYTS